MEEFTEQEVQEVAITPEGWGNVPTLDDLKRDLEQSEPYHQNQVAKIKNWLENLHVEGKAKPKEVQGRSSVQPKLIRKQAEWRYPALSEPFLASDSLFKVKPRTWEDVKSAQQNETVLNYQFNTKLDKVNFVDASIRTFVDEGTVIAKLGWHTEEEEYTESVPIVEFAQDPGVGELLDQLTELRNENPNHYQRDVPPELQRAHEYSLQTRVPHRPVITGYEEQTSVRTLENKPTVEICDYERLTVDPSCQGDLDKAKFIIYEYPTSLSDLRQSGINYQNLDAINLETGSILAEPDSPPAKAADFNFKDKARKRIFAREYWGFWDITGTGVVVPIVATWVGNIMIRLEESPFPDRKLPFVSAAMLPVKDSIYGEPDGELLEANQKIVGAITRGMIDVMGRSANGQRGYQKGALDATNKRKFQRGQDYEFNGNVDPHMSFYMHTYPEIPSSAAYMLDHENMDAEAMTGVRAFSKGISGDSLGDVATGIRGALDAASKRETGILRRLAQFMSRIGQKIISMNQEFLDEEEVVRVTNDEFVPIRRDDLAGFFDLSVDVSSLEEDNVKAQELAFMLQTIGPKGDSAITMKILTKISKLRKMPDLAHEFENYKPEPDPLAQALQQMELMEKEANIAKLHAEVNSKESAAILNRAKALSEQARARELGSRADLNDLNFVEQESGVTQERAKELHGEQARANQGLEVVKDRLAQNRERAKAGTDLLKDYIKASAA